MDWEKVVCGVFVGPVIGKGSLKKWDETMKKAMFAAKRNADKKKKNLRKDKRIVKNERKNGKKNFCS